MNHMHKTHPKIIIVLGPSASGKTTLSQKLSTALQLPYFSKDDIKERLFDSLGWTDREWSQKLGLVSIILQFDILAQELRAGRSCIVETNFVPAWDTPRFQALMEQYPYTPLQILCRAEGPILLDRFKQRATAGDRHPGHVDDTNYNAYKDQLLHDTPMPLDLPGDVLRVDTSDFATVPEADIIEQVRAFLAQPGQAE